jgi:hypothetical protein
LPKHKSAFKSVDAPTDQSGVAVHRQPPVEREIEVTVRAETKNLNAIRIAIFGRWSRPPIAPKPRSVTPSIATRSNPKRLPQENHWSG